MAAPRDGAGCVMATPAKRLLPPESRLVYRLPKPAPGGRTELLLSPIQLLRALARFVPPPRVHRHRITVSSRGAPAERGQTPCRRHAHRQATRLRERHIAPRQGLPKPESRQSAQSSRSVADNRHLFPGRGHPCPPPVGAGHTEPSGGFSGATSRPDVERWAAPYRKSDVPPAYRSGQKLYIKRCPKEYTLQMPMVVRRHA